MNPLRQFVQILTKDVRGHALEIGLVLALNVVFTLALTVTWTELQNTNYRPLPIAGAAQILLVVACCALIARVVQSDSVAGKAPFWLTRPYSRPALLASKIAFALLFVHVPIFLSQLAIVTGSGVPLSLPQLLATQAAFMAAVTLPLIALAALTTTFSRFVIGGVLLAPFALVVRQVLYLSGTFLVATALATLALIAGTTLACQYRWRSTLRVAAWSLGALFLVTLSLVGLEVMPAGNRLVVRARAAFLPSQTIASTIRLGDASQRGDLSYAPPFVSLPIEAEITFDQSIRRYQVEVLAADGREIGLVGTGARLRFTAANVTWLDLQFAQADYDALEDSVVSVRLEIDIMTFESRETEPIPLDGSFAIVDGRAQCGLENPYQIICRTSSGRESTWQPDASNTEVQLTWLPIWHFALNPIRAMQISPRPRPTSPWPGTSVATVVRERLSYTRQDVTFENIRLSDWAP